jgi:hypothetical protein
MVIVVAVCMAVVVTMVTLLYWLTSGARSDCRSQENYITDIRAMNSYNSYFVGAIAIVIGLVAEGRILPDAALVLLLVAFWCGSGSLFFFPLPRPGSAAPGSGDGPAPALTKGWWLSKVVLSQLTVVFSVFGISDVVIEAVF